jgi:hypothetical protein
VRAEEGYMGWHLLEPGSIGSPVPAWWRELDYSRGGQKKREKVQKHV